MQSFRLIITDTAKTDLRNIRNHIDKDSPENAKTFVKDLTTKLYGLAASGVTGSSRDNVQKGLRGFLYRGRCFYFHFIDDKMYVIRVLNSRQDITLQDFPHI
ncbi:MAG: type II toxin-antitoxin system RelE/ParE family toxin [Proteobacteria bacterium]|nr:type II toxin-antitoxin system RelE/ParE family toxin [Pseudomonadota bacterium]